MPRLSETTFIICTMMTRMLQRFTRSESMAKDAKKYIRLTFLHGSTLGQYIYTSGTESDGAIYQLDTASDSLSKVYECNSFKPIVTSDDNVYYMDVDQNNALVHTNMKSGHPVTLTKDSLDLYNVYGSSIFYQRYSEDNPALCMIKNDGSGYQELAQGNYSNINVTSSYIYFTDFKTKEMFCTPTDHPGTLTAFHPGVIKK